MTAYAYCRISTKSQDPGRQLDKLRELVERDEHIFKDEASGKDYERPEWKTLKRILSKGDLVYIDSLDRMGRNYRETIGEWNDIVHGIGADIVVLDGPELFDSRKYREMGETGEFMENMILSTLAYIADAERRELLRRTNEGVARAKEAGKYKGSQPKAIDKDRFEALYHRVKMKERTAASAYRELGISKGLWFKLVAEFEEPGHAEYDKRKDIR